MILSVSHTILISNCNHQEAFIKSDILEGHWVIDIGTLIATKLQRICIQWIVLTISSTVKTFVILPFVLTLVTFCLSHDFSDVSLRLRRDILYSLYNKVSDNTIFLF